MFHPLSYGCLDFKHECPRTPQTLLGSRMKQMESEKRVGVLWKKRDIVAIFENNNIEPFTFRRERKPNCAGMVRVPCDWLWISQLIHENIPTSSEKAPNSRMPKIGVCEIIWISSHNIWHETDENTNRAQQILSKIKKNHSLDFIKHHFTNRLSTKERDKKWSNELGGDKEWFEDCKILHNRRNGSSTKECHFNPYSFGWKPNGSIIVDPSCLLPPVLIFFPLYSTLASTEINTESLWLFRIAFIFSFFHTLYFIHVFSVSIW